MTKRKKQQNDNSLCTIHRKKRISKGICHTFSSKTNTSERTRMAGKVLNDGLKRELGKQSLLEEKFRNVVRVKEEDIKQFADMKDKNKGKKMFFSGKTKTEDNEPEEINVPDSVCIPVLDNPAMKIHNLNENGSIVCVDYDSGDFVFALIPRADVSSYNHYHSFIEGLQSLEECSPANVSVRGNKRTVLYEGSKDSSSNYLTYGVAPKRSGRGLYTKSFKGLSGTKGDEAIMSMREFIGTTCSKYIPHLIKSGMSSILKLFKLNPTCVPKDSTLDEKFIVDFMNFFPSLASGRNTSLNLHQDDDAFLSVVSVYNEDDISNQITRRTGKKRKTKISLLKKKTSILKFFNFGVGHSVALRTGDILMFNPMIEHCISTKTNDVENSDVYCVSFYFKSLVLGLNDNSIEVEN